jgi:hypothetical protein
MSCLKPAIENAWGAIALHTMPGVTQYKKTEVALPGRLNYLRKSGEHPVSVNVLYQTLPAPRPVVTATPAAVFRTYLQPVRGSSLELRGDSQNVRNCCIVSWH